MLLLFNGTQMRRAGAAVILAAVGAANQVYFIFTVVLFGLFSGMAVYTAQFERTPIDYYVELTDEVKAVVLAPEAGTYALIFAAYDSNGVLKSVELQNITFDEAGEQEFEPETLETNGAAKIKVMLWSDISEMTPKCGSDEMSLQ